MKWFPRNWPANRLLRHLLQCLVLCCYGLLVLILLVAGLFLAFQHPSFSGWALRTLLTAGFKPFPEAIAPAVQETIPATLKSNRLGIQPDSLFQWDHAWHVHLNFTSNQWAALSPVKIPTLSGKLSPQMTLRNPHASRAGLLGVIGWDLPWSQALSLDFEGLHFVAPRVRYKGNGTFLESKDRYKRSFKLKLSPEENPAGLLGHQTLNFHSLLADRTRMSDALGYAYFKAINIPSPRTSYLDLTLAIEGILPASHLGLYLMVEKPDGQWLDSQWGQSGGALLKPVTMKLFDELEGGWEAYEAVYDPKTPLSEAQQAHLMSTIRWFNQPDQEGFQAGWETYFDLESVARFFAAQVLLSNYDGILFNGQNFLMTMQPQTHRIAFAPWDLDHSWGEFPLTGTLEQRTHASITHPWIGDQFFVERLFQSEVFLRLYNQALRDQLQFPFTLEHISQQMDRLAPLIRPVLQHEPAPTTAQFDQAQASQAQASVSGSDTKGTEHPSHQIKVFIQQRRESVLAQLEGREVGQIITFEMGSSPDPE